MSDVQKADSNEKRAARKVNEIIKYAILYMKGFRPAFCQIAQDHSSTSTSRAAY